jgi:endogenous inhibitor of DNA gyrase (YacG/DUF329 family)
VDRVLAKSDGERRKEFGLPLDIVRCPTCGKSVAWLQTPTRPFCSPECKWRDLGNWATERYRIPAEDTENHETPSDGDDVTPPRRR